MKSLLVAALGLILFALGLVINHKTAVWSEESVNRFSPAPAGLGQNFGATRIVYHYDYSGTSLLDLGMILTGIGAFGWVRPFAREL